MTLPEWPPSRGAYRSRCHFHLLSQVQHSAPANSSTPFGAGRTSPKIGLPASRRLWRLSSEPKPDLSTQPTLNLGSWSKSNSMVVSRAGFGMYPTPLDCEPGCPTLTVFPLHLEGSRRVGHGSLAWGQLTSIPPAYGQEHPSVSLKQGELGSIKFAIPVPPTWFSLQLQPCHDTSSWCPRNTPEYM